MTILTSFVIRSQNIISLNDGSLTSTPHSIIPTREVQTVSDGIIVTYEFSHALIQADDVYQNSIWWKIGGFGHNENPSEAAVPERLDQFSTSSENGIEVSVIFEDYVDFQYELTPARSALPDNDYSIHSINTVLPIVCNDTFFPNKIVEKIDNQIYRGSNIVNIKVTPIQYNSARGIVRAYKKIVYKLTIPELDNETENLRSENYKFMSKDFFLNNTTLNGDYRNLETRGDETCLDPQGYLILSVPKFAAAVNSFAEWKKLLGFDIEIVIKDDWSQNMVKEVIKKKYNKMKNLYYLLIIGDHEDVPGMISNLKYPHVTDFYYTCLDNEDDLTPDIYRGRISVSNPEEASVVINKIIDYEKNPVTESSFYKNGINCSFFQDENKDGYADRRFAQTSEDVRNYLVSQGKSIQRIYKAKSDVTPIWWNKGSYSNGEELPSELKKPQFAWNGNFSDIIHAINSGGFYVLHRDHGGTDGWGDPSFSSKNISSLNNGQLQPIVFSINCLTGKFNSTTCFAEHFLRKADGGCVAIYGATEVSYSGYNDVLTGGMFDAIWSTPGLRIVMPGQVSSAPTPKPVYRLGQILDQGLNRLEEIYGSPSRNSFVKYTREIFHCFGDPSMYFPTACPTTFSNASCVRNSHDVAVTSGQEATISFYDKVYDKVTSYTGTAATYITDHPTNISVCISSHNKIPFIQEGSAPSEIFIQNKEIYGYRNYTASRIKIGSNVTDELSHGPVEFDGGVVKMKGDDIQIRSNTTIKKGTVLTLTN